MEVDIWKRNINIGKNKKVKNQQGKKWGNMKGTILKYPIL